MWVGQGSTCGLGEYSHTFHLTFPTTLHPTFHPTFHPTLHPIATGTQEFVTVAGSQTQGALGVWPLTTNPPPVSLEQPPSNQHAAGAVAGQPPQLATRVGDRPLTIVTAHGGRVVMTGMVGGWRRARGGGLCE